jgi:hypothetical protein
MAEDIELMSPIEDRRDVAALAPKPALIGSKTRSADVVGRVLLGAPDPVTRIVVQEPRQQVEVRAIERGDDDLNPVGHELGDKCVDDSGAVFRLDTNAMACHERS